MARGTRMFVYTQSGWYCDSCGVDGADVIVNENVRSCTTRPVMFRRAINALYWNDCVENDAVGRLVDLKSGVNQLLPVTVLQFKVTLTTLVLGDVSGAVHVVAAVAVVVVAAVHQLTPYASVSTASRMLVNDVFERGDVFVRFITPDADVRDTMVLV